MKVWPLVFTCLWFQWVQKSTSVLYRPDLRFPCNSPHCPNSNALGQECSQEHVVGCCWVILPDNLRVVHLPGSDCQSAEALCESCGIWVGTEFGTISCRAGKWCLRSFICASTRPDGNCFLATPPRSWITHCSLQIWLAVTWPLFMHAHTNRYQEH